LDKVKWSTTGIDHISTYSLPEYVKGQNFFQ
jgi:hypothetical protein